MFWQDSRLLEGQPFAQMPLVYERAAGGPGTSNPAGMRFDAAPDAYGSVPIPNLQPAGDAVRWAKLEQHWSEAISIETGRGKSALLQAFDSAYVARLEEERGQIQIEE